MGRNPERAREWRRNWLAQNKDRINEQRRLNRQRNRDRYLQTQRAYRERNKDYINEQGRTRRAANRERYKQYHTKHKHGMRPEDFAVFLQAQDGRCYLCGDALDPERMHVDHDHSHCGEKQSCPICRRGLACPDCNCAVGYARDEPNRLRRMADALEAAQAAVNERKAADDAEQLPLFVS